MTFNVGSEVGQLRQAIVHRPGLELSRLTPDNIESLLFDDVVWASKAKEEHDAFAEALRDKGVVVHYYGQLLAETLELPAGRAFVLDRLCTPEILGPSLVGPVRRLFEDQDANDAGRGPHRRRPQGGPAPAARPQLEVEHAQGRRLHSPPAAQPSLPARQLVLDLRRGDHQPHGHAGPPTRIAAHPGHLPASIRSSPTPTSSPTTEART